MISTVIFRSTVIVFCDLAAVASGAWILWQSSAESVVSGPVESKLLFVLVVALLLGIRHTVSRSTDSAQIKTRVARVTLVADLFLAAAGLIAWQALDIYYLGWLTTFALMAFIIGTGFQLLVDVVTSRNRSVSGEQEQSPKKPSFATELTRLAGGIGAVIGFAYMSPIHAWDVAFINPLVMMIALAIGVSVIPTGLSHTRVLTQSSLSDDLDFSSREHDNTESVKVPGPVRVGNASSTINPSGEIRARGIVAAPEAAGAPGRVSTR